LGVVYRFFWVRSTHHSIRELLKTSVFRSFHNHEENDSFLRGTSKNPNMVFRCSLTLYPAGGVAAGKFFNFICGNNVEVALDGVFKTACGNGKFKPFLRRHTLKIRVD